MSTGGGFCKRLKVSQVTSGNSDAATSNLESRSSSSEKTVLSLSGNLEMSSTKVVHEQLECPICMNLMNPPIYQCPSGHTLCSSCKARVHKRCPSCPEDLGNIRCLALEKIAESFNLPCRYKSSGCNEILPSFCRLKHEENCKYRPFMCPFPGRETCCVTGDIPFLVMHLNEYHNVVMQGCSSVNSNPQILPIPRPTGKITVFTCFGRHFCIIFESWKLEMAPVYMVFVQFMGDNDEAKQFAYSLEVHGNDRKLVWEGVPQSIRDSHRRILDCRDGLIIHGNSKLFFLNDRQRRHLKLTGRIWRKS